MMQDEPEEALAILHRLRTAINGQIESLTYTAYDALRTKAEAVFKVQGDLRYSCVYADPPWGYKDSKNVIGTSEQYDVMSLESIAALPVAGLVAENSVCLMWVTAPMIENALHVMRAWGFEYRTVFITWIKVTGFLQNPHYSKGSYTKPNAEFLLLGARGSLQVSLRAKFGTDSLLVARRPGSHSRKPACVRSAIVEVFGDLPRIELFAREKEPGWDVWGNNTAFFVNEDAHKKQNLRNGRRRINDLSMISNYTIRYRRNQNRDIPARSDRGAKSLMSSYYNRPTECAMMSKMEYKLIPSMRECSCECTCDDSFSDVLGSTTMITEYTRLATPSNPIDSREVSPRHPLYNHMTLREARSAQSIIKAHQQYNADLLYCVRHNKDDKKRGKKACAFVQYSGDYVPLDTANDVGDAPPPDPRLHIRINKKPRHK